MLQGIVWYTMRRTIDEKTRQAIEAVLSRDRRVELIPTRDGVRVLELRPVAVQREAASDGSKGASADVLLPGC